MKEGLLTPHHNANTPSLPEAGTRSRCFAAVRVTRTDINTALYVSDIDMSC